MIIKNHHKIKYNENLKKFVLYWGKLDETHYVSLFDTFSEAFQAYNGTVAKSLGIDLGGNA